MRELPDKLRAFVAIRLDPGVESAIEAFVQNLRENREYDGVRWVTRANLHVTLRFLGVAVPAEMVVLLDAVLARIGAATRPFIVEARGTGAFPNWSRPRVVWIGLQSDSLIELAGRIAAAATECGFPSEPRPYSPHLTIGRVRGMLGGEPFREMIASATDREFGQSVVNSLILYRSILGARAANYEELARYPLGASG
jgi:2'-5' RNA ligase